MKTKEEKKLTNINILLNINDVDRLDNYLNSGDENIEDILTEITMQANEVISRLYTISHIQRKAIQKILTKRNSKCSKFIEHALGAEKSLDRLSYRKARMIIRYCNK